MNDGSSHKAFLLKTWSGFKWSYVSVAVQALLQLTILSTLARLLSPEEFGIVGIALIFSTFVERVGFLGLGPAIVQRNMLNEHHLRVGFTISVLLGLLMLIVFYLAAPSIAQFFNEPLLTEVLRAISLVFFIESFGTLSMNFLQRELRFKELAIITNIAYFLGNGVVGIVLAYQGFGVWSLVYATIANRLFRTISFLYLVPQYPTFRIFSQESAALLEKGVGFSLGRLLNYLALNGDNFIIGHILGAEALGMYGRAYQLMTLPATYLGQVLEKVLFPAMSRLQDDKPKLRIYFLYGIECAALVGIPVGIFLYLAAPETILVLFGPTWVQVTPVLQILAFAVFFRLCYKNSDTVIRALGAVYQLAFSQALYSGLVVSGAIIGSYWGLEGVSLAVIFAVVINYGLLSFMSMRLLQIGFAQFFRAHLGAIWVGAWVYLAVQPAAWFLRQHEISPFFTLPLLAFATAIVGLTAMLSTPSRIRMESLTLLSSRVNFSNYGRAGKLLSLLLRRTA